jgi:hypothetical protein
MSKDDRSYTGWGGLDTACFSHFYHLRDFLYKLMWNNTCVRKNDLSCRYDTFLENAFNGIDALVMKVLFVKVHLRIFYGLVFLSARSGT